MVTLQEEAPEVEVENCEASGQKYHDHIYPDLQGSMGFFGLGTRYSADLDKFVHKTQAKEDICRIFRGFGSSLECFHVCLFRLTSFLLIFGKAFRILR